MGRGGRDRICAQATSSSTSNRQNLYQNPSVSIYSVVVLAIT